jgi:hypothetical protein
MGAGPVRKATTGIMESWRARVHKVFLVCLRRQMKVDLLSVLEAGHSERVKAIGKYQDKSTAFVASPPSAGLFLGVQQRPRVGVFTH